MTNAMAEVLNAFSNNMLTLEIPEQEQQQQQHPVNQQHEQQFQDIIDYQQQEIHELQKKIHELENPQQQKQQLCQFGAGSSDKIEIVSKRENFNKKFNVKTREIVFKFGEFKQDFSLLPQWFDECIQDILSVFKKDFKPEDKLGIKIHIPNYTDMKAIGFNFKPIHEIDSSMISDLFLSIAQSNTTFLSTELIEMTGTVIITQTGTGLTSIINLNTKEILKKKKNSIIDLSEKHGDLSCLPVSLLAGKLFADNNYEMFHLNKIKKSTIQKFIKSANVELDNINGCNFNDIVKFQKILSEYNIKVFLNKSNSQEFFSCKDTSENKEINLFYFQDIKHFVAIKKVNSFFGKNYYCKYCYKVYNNLHKCTEQCKYCKGNPPCEYVNTNGVTCAECNRTFRGQICFENHKQNKYGKEIVCKQVFLCNKCLKYIDNVQRNNIVHKCDEKFCRICNKIVDRKHFCYIKKYNNSLNKNVNWALIFYDFECTQEKKISDISYVHEPILCVANVVCKFCYDIDELVECEKCGKRQNIFENSDCVSKFIDFLFEHKIKRICCIAHNFKSYDGQFIFNELLKRDKEILPIMGGLKILKITVNQNISFIDSLNFLPMSLSKFAKTFNLKQTKGYYPHLFNTKENYNKICEIPPVNMFCIDNFNEKENKDFFTWYDDMKKQNYVFNNRNELIKYCSNDVEILRQGCIKFLKEFKEMFDINPFFEAFTIAQTVMLIYRKHYLTENTLGIIPFNNYNEKQNQSFIATKWLEWENEKENGDIIYEKVLPDCGLQVDGYIPGKRTIYEFLGCYYHGCPECFLNRNSKDYNQLLGNRYENTLYKIKFLQKLKYSVITMWECKFRDILKKDKALNSKLNSLPRILYSILEPRDSICGGRVEIFKAYYKCKSNEKIKYLDFTSLYPYVNKFGKYPIKHPEIIKSPHCKNMNIFEIDGLVKCLILPPQNLKIPILPSKINNKLYFVLCRTCAEIDNVVKACEHTEFERALLGVWVACEIKLSLEFGYTIIEIFEIWKYETVQYDPVTKSGGLFSNYMDTFLKLKQEASGYPVNCITEEEKDSFINDFEIHEGIKLEKDKIIKNPSKRNSAKLCLNSLWGKFGQRNNMSQTTVCKSYDEFFKIMQSKGIEIIDIFVPSSEYKNIYVNWKYKNDESYKPLKHSSIPVAAYTTAHARIKLYYLLNSLGDNLLYCDTDSIIYIDNENLISKPQTGVFLGELTDELAEHGKNTYITEFVAFGPKSYAYKYKTPNTNKVGEVAKCKGILYNLPILSFKNFKNIVLDPENDKIYKGEIPKKIKRKKHFQIVTEPEEKRIKFTYTKRICNVDLSTIPYGYRKIFPDKN
jgi:DNA polymerase type B, organellar and viral